MPRPPLFRLALALVLVAGLAACDSAEERAEKHFQSGMQLLETGETDKALVEFRNVFNLNGRHREARRTYAEVLSSRGDTRGAYGHYLRLVEQYPDDGPALIELAQMAFESQNWEEFDRHGAAAVAAAPAEAAVKAIDVGLKYRAAVLAEDAAARGEALKAALALREDMPDSPILRRVIVDGYLQDRDLDAALAEIDRTLAAEPDNDEARATRIAILAETGNMDGVEAELKAMVALNSEDEAARATLLRFYLSRGQRDEAEAVLREGADPAAEEPAAYLALVRFVLQLRGPEAAIAELDTGIAAREAAGGDTRGLRAVRAGVDFELGRRDEAIAAVEAALEGAPAGEETRRIKIALAKMLGATGNEVGARRLVEEVLAEDRSQVDALKMQAVWQITADDVDGAVATLRTALDQAPRDAEAMTLMAEAYSRGGSHELARDFLSLAVEASGAAPEESIRYARLLIGEERFQPAEDTLIAALRIAPGNEELLTQLGQLYLAMEDQARARQVIDTLRRSTADTARRTADLLEAELLARTGGTDEAIAFLDGLAVEGDVGARIAAIRARLGAGDAAGALAAAEELAAEQPDNPNLRFMRAAVRAAAGDLPGAEEDYRALTAAAPQAPQVRLQLARILASQGRSDEAEAAIDEGLVATPDAPDLLWAKASYLERRADIDGAIAIYEALYARDSTSVIVANNLASLLSTWRDDPESLERAYAIGRRLRSTEVPALADTYGWILHRRGEHAEAAGYLEKAAAGLPEDALVQYHLGAAYLALDRKAEALVQFEKAVSLAGAIDTRPQIGIARAEIEKLKAEDVE